MAYLTGVAMIDHAADVQDPGEPDPNPSVDAIHCVHLRLCRDILPCKIHALVLCGALTGRVSQGTLSVLAMAGDDGNDFALLSLALPASAAEPEEEEGARERGRGEKRIRDEAQGGQL